MMDDFPPRTPIPIPAMTDEMRQEFQRVGWILVAIGLLSILFPLVASIAAKVMVGVALMIAGAFVLYHAFQARVWSAAIWSGLVGVLNLAVGAYLSFLPLSGLIGLTFLMGLSFVVQGGFEGAIALRQRPRQGWGWLAFSAAAALILGVMLIAGLPGTALWALGLMLGLNLLTSGLSFVALARHGVE